MISALWKERVPKSRTISLTMYLSIPLLCSGWRKERNSCSFSNWSPGGLSAWNQRSFRLSRTSWAATRRQFSLNFFQHIFTDICIMFLRISPYCYILTFLVKFQIFVILYLLSRFLFIETFAGQKFDSVFIPCHMTYEQSTSWVFGFVLNRKYSLVYDTRLHALDEKSRDAGALGLSLSPSPSGSTARKLFLFSTMASWKCSSVFSIIQRCISLALTLLSLLKSTLKIDLLLIIYYYYIIIWALIYCVCVCVYYPL